MALSNIKSRKAILSAINEYNKLGRDVFLNKYGFRPARLYFLAYDGKLYDAKAIIGVAHRYEFPQKGPLKPAEFSGGERTVKQKLEELGFKVRGPRPGCRPVKPVRNLRSMEAANALQAQTIPLEAALKECRKTARRGYQIAKESLQESAKAIDKARTDLSQCLQAIKENHIRTSGIIPQLKKQLSEVVTELDKLKRASASELEERRQRLDNFSITLFGRTMAGKSTLMEILTRGDGQSIGKGGQRTTRDIRRYAWNGLEITDVPGTAAFEGEIDTEFAFKAASQADLVLFLITDDAPQTVEAECLARVLRLGKPVLGICNVKVAIEDEDDLRLFLRKPEKYFDQTRLEQLFNQFHALADQHVPGARMPFMVTHLRARFLAQQLQFAAYRERLLAASRFEGVKSQIVREVVERGTFLRVKSFIDGIVVPMMDVTDRLLEFNRQNSKIWQDLFDKRRQLENWRKEFGIKGQALINSDVSTIFNRLPKEVDPFSEDYVGKCTAGAWWEYRVKSTGINFELEALAKNLLHEYQRELSKLARELKPEPPFNATFSGTSHIKTDKINDSKKMLVWGTKIIATGLGMAAMVLPPLKMPLGLAATATEFGGRLASARMESGEEKRNRARKNLTDLLLQNIAKMEQEVRQQLSDWFTQKLLGGATNVLLTALATDIECLSQLANAQRFLAWSLNAQQKALHRGLVSKALTQLKAQNLKNSILDVARVPGQATMLLIAPRTMFPGRTRNGLERLLGEEILFVTQTKDQLSILAQALGPNCDRNTINIEIGNRVARLPIDALGPSIKTRIQLAQQLTGLHMIRKET